MPLAAGSSEAVVTALVVGFGAGERIDPVALGMAAAALDPVPFDAMARRGRDQLLPQIGILDRLLVGSAPAVPLPVVNPTGNAVADVDAVGVELHAARAFQRFKPFDRRHQLHAV